MTATDAQQRHHLCPWSINGQAPTCQWLLQQTAGSFTSVSSYFGIDMVHSFAKIIAINI